MTRTIYLFGLLGFTAACGTTLGSDGPSAMGSGGQGSATGGGAATGGGQGVSTGGGASGGAASSGGGEHDGAGGVVTGGTGAGASTGGQTGTETGGAPGAGGGVTSSCVNGDAWPTADPTKAGPFQVTADKAFGRGRPRSHLWRRAAAIQCVSPNELGGQWALSPDPDLGEWISGQSRTKAAPMRGRREC